jgi:hypothetical protein
MGSSLSEQSIVHTASFLLLPAVLGIPKPELLRICETVKIGNSVKSSHIAAIVFLTSATAGLFWLIPLFHILANRNSDDGIVATLCMEIERSRHSGAPAASAAANDLAVNQRDSLVAIVLPSLEAPRSEMKPGKPIGDLAGTDSIFGLANYFFEPFSNSYAYRSGIKRLASASDVLLQVVSDDFSFDEYDHEQHGKKEVLSGEVNGKLVSYCAIGVYKFFTMVRREAIERRMSGCDDVALKSNEFLRISSEGLTELIPDLKFRKGIDVFGIHNELWKCLLYRLHENEFLEHLRSRFKANMRDISEHMLGGMDHPLYRRVTECARSKFIDEFRAAVKSRGVIEALDIDAGALYDKMEYENFVHTSIALFCAPNSVDVESIKIDIESYVEDSSRFNFATVWQAAEFLCCRGQISAAQLNESIQPGSDCAKLFLDVVSISNRCARFVAESVTNEQLNMQDIVRTNGMWLEHGKTKLGKDKIITNDAGEILLESIIINRLATRLLRESRNFDEPMREAYQLSNCSALDEASIGVS